MNTPKWVIPLEQEAIVSLDLRSLASLWHCSAAELLAMEGQVELAITWQRPPGDPRELSASWFWIVGAKIMASGVGDAWSRWLLCWALCWITPFGWP